MGPLTEQYACVAAGATRVLWSLTNAAVVFGDLDELCHVSSVDETNDVQAVGLDCPTGERELRMTTSAPHVSLEIASGVSVRLIVVGIPNGDIPSVYFMLRDGSDNDLLAAGIDGPATSLVLEPLDVSLHTSSCERGGTCELLQRGALLVKSGDSEIVLFDGHAAEFGDDPRYQLLVGEATRQDCYDPNCTPSNYASWTVRSLLIAIR